MIERRGDAWVVSFGFWIGPGVFLRAWAEIEREERPGRFLLPWPCPWNDLVAGHRGEHEG